MTRKPRRPGTRGGRRVDNGPTDPFERVQLPRPKVKGRLPTDIVDAAEAALDDMLQRAPEGEDEEIRTQTRSLAPGATAAQVDDDPVSVTRQLSTDEDEPISITRQLGADPAVPGARDDESATTDRRSRMPLVAPPRTTAVHTLGGTPTNPLPRASPVPAPASSSRASPLPSESRTQSPSASRASPLPSESRGSAPSASRVSPLPSESRASAASASRASPLPSESRASAPSASRVSPLPSESRASAPSASRVSPLPSESRASPLPSESPWTPSTRSPTPVTRPTPTPTMPRTQSPSVHTPTPTPSITKASPLPPVHTPSPLISRSRSAVTHGETPQTRVEPTTSDRGGLFEETARVSAELLDMESGAAETDPDRLVPLRPELASLQVALYEDATQLTNAKQAIVGAGHVVDTVATSRDGIQRVIDAIRNRVLDVVIVALPNGAPIIEAALALEPRRPVVIAAVAASAVDAVARAHAAGADLAVTRPHDVERLAPILLAAARLQAERRRAFASRNSDRVIRTRLEAPAEPEPRALLSFETFRGVVEAEIQRAHKGNTPLSIALFVVNVLPPPPPGVGGILRARAGNALLNAVRDIDTAAQLDQDRFLVLFPYTDPGSAAGIAKRVTGAVAALDPVVAGGRSFPPRVIAGVAGALLGQPLSFDKLINDATRALEQARRDNVEIAVKR